MCRRPTPIAIVTLAAALALAGCGSGGTSGQGGTRSGDGSSKVLATTAIWADVVSAVTCRTLKVPALIPAGVDTHEFEPSVQDADRLLGADLVFGNGMGLEGALGDTLTSAKKEGVDVVELAPDMKPIDQDPHVWMDPERVALAVPVIAKHLAKHLGGAEGLGLDPAKLAGCADDYVSQLQDLAISMDTRLAAVAPAQRKLVTNHENLAYFADRFDFTIIGALIPSTSSLGESDPRSLDELAATVQQAGVKTIFVDVVGSTRLAKSLAERSDQDIAVEKLFVESLGPKGDDADTYRGMMSVNATRIAESLSR
ncbi:MAG: metal ABC transporter substrate-binding protein [Microthrixaceae bacterium]